MARPVSALTTFIRSLPTDLPAKDVLAQAKVAGHETSESNVSRVRADMKAVKTVSKKTSRRPAPKKSREKKGAAQKPTTPKNTASSKKAAKKTSAARKAPASKGAPLSKSAFIRNLPLTLSAKEVVVQGKAAGIEFDDKYVHNIRRAAELKGSAKKTSTSSEEATPKKPVSKTRAPKKTVASKRTAASKTPTTKKSVESKADFVRARAHLSPKEIVEDAKAQGLKLEASYVYNVRGQDRAISNKKARAASNRSAAKTVSTKATASATKESPKPAPANGTHRTDTSVEDLLKAAAAELGLGKAIEILQGERARVRAVLGG